MGEYKHGFGGRDYGSQKRRFYDRWQYMITRCHNRNRADWKNYGGRGITVSDEWLSFTKFRDDMYDDFVSHCGRYGYRNTTLDRIDQNAGYSKKNCRWATKREQAENTRKTLTVLYNGKPTTIGRVSELTGRRYQTIYCRVVRGIPLEAPFRKSPSRTR